MSGEQAAILRAPDVAKILNISKPSLYKWIRLSRFPRGVRYGPRLVGWSREVVEAWVQSRLADPTALAQGGVKTARGPNQGSRSPDGHSSQGVLRDHQ